MENKMENETEFVNECYISKNEMPHMEYKVVEIPKRNLIKYVRCDMTKNYELEIDITKLSKSKYKKFLELTKGSIIEK